MRYVYFGRTGVKVSQLCLGTMTFGNEADEAMSRRIMDRALEAGINFFDTANIYTRGASESIIGRWLGPHRESIILASKVHSPMGDGPNERGSSRRHIMLEVEKSLKRLDTDWLDIYYLHQWDSNSHLEESLYALTTLVEQGKVLYCGVSNFSAWQTVKAIGVTRERGFAPISCIQPMYSLLKRQVEVEILPMAQSEQLAVCPYSPMGAGMLTGKYQRGETGRIAQNKMYGKRYEDEKYPEISARFVDYARARDIAPAALAVAWVMNHPAITSAIIGARNLEQFNDALPCADLDMTVEMRDEISALSYQPPLATDRERMG